MQTNENGDVILNIGVNINNARKSVQSFARDINNAFKALKGQSVSTPQLDKLESQAAQSKQKIIELQKTLQGMRESFSDKPTQEMQRLIDKENELEAAAKRVKSQITSTTPKPLADKYTAQYNDIRRQIEGVSEQQMKLKESGRAFLTVAQQQPQAFAKTNDELRKEQSNLAGIQAKIESIRNAGERAANGVNNSFKKMTSLVAAGFRKIRDHAKSGSASAANSFGSLNDAVKKGFKTFLKYGLGVRSFFFLFRKLRTAVINGYKELAQSSDEVNESISNVKSSLAKLRNATAAAIQPLVQSFAPVITMLANKMTTAMEAMGQFFAALTGQEYVYKALDVQEDYAASLSDTADNAQKATKALDKYLSPLDDINRYTESSEETDGGTAATTKFAQDAVGNSFKKLAESIKDYFTDIFKPIKAAWDKYGFGVMMEWRKVLVNIKGTIKDIARAFRNVWTNGTGQRVSENILKLWKSIGGIINGIIESFRNAWNKDALGESVIQSFIDKFDRLLTFIRTVADTFRQAFNDGTGERIWSNILETVRNINNIIGGFWGKLTDAWKANDNGLKIWNAILGVVEDVTEWFKDMSKITFDWVSDLNFNPLLEAIGLLIQGFRDLAKAVGGKLKEVYKDILLPLAKWTLEKGLPKLIEWVSAAFKLLADAISAIPIEVIKNIAITIGVLYAAIKTLSILTNIIKWFQNIAKAFSLLKAALVAHPYVAALVAIAAAITAVVTAIQVANRTKWERSDLKKAVDEINAYSDEMSEAANNMKSTIESVNESHLEVQADVTQVMNLKSRLQDIINDNLITEDEMPEYKTIMDLLKQVDGFEEKWSELDLEEVNGQIVIHTNIDEVNAQLDDFFDKWQAAQYKTSLSSSISELYQSQFTNKKDIKKAENNVSKAYKEIFDTVSAHYAKYSNSIFGAKIREAGGVKSWIDQVLADGVDDWKYLFPWGEHWDELFNGLASATDSLEDYNFELGETEKAYQDAQRALNFLNGDTSDYVGALYAVESGLMSEDQALKMLEGTGIHTFDQLRTAANNQRDAEIGNNEERAKSYSDTADETEKNYTRTAESAQKAADAEKAASDEATQTINDNLKSTADEAEKSSSIFSEEFMVCFEAVKERAKELWDKIKEIFSGASGIGEGIANWAISGINAAIRAVNNAFRWICEFINDHILNPLRNIDIGGWRPLSGLPVITAPPQIGEIPALAQGAVLPAGKPFLAMLGDQQNGRNLEAPESLIRKIVREETQNMRSSNNSYNVNVQVGNKTLLSFVLNEAEMQRNQSGFNPFLMGTR